MPEMTVFIKNKPLHSYTCNMSAASRGIYDQSDHREISLSDTAFDVINVAEKEFEVVEDVQG